MRTKLLFGVSLIAISALIIVAYFFVGIPGTAEAAKFNPSSPTTVFDACSGKTIRVIPFNDFPKALRDALSVAEPSQLQYAEVARRSLCNSRRRALRYSVDSYRLSQKLRFRFSADEIQTIYLNEIYLGNDTFGVESGALLYAQKHAKGLNLSESALLVGVIRSPARYSPLKYPDAARTRRNQILDLMAAQNLISVLDAEHAKGEPLPTN
jgi:membrane carboxypeptidase/penicillin-binding protein